MPCLTSVVTSHDVFVRPLVQCLSVRPPKAYSTNMASNQSYLEFDKCRSAADELWAEQERPQESLFRLRSHVCDERFANFKDVRAEIITFNVLVFNNVKRNTQSNSADNCSGNV